MKKKVKKGLVIGAIIFGIIILFFIISSYSFSKSFPYIGWGNVCSPKCYINKLLGNTMITNNPVLDVFETIGPNAYRYDWYVESKRNMTINISILNIGKTKIPRANVNLSLEDSGIFEPVYQWWWDNEWKIQDLDAMESRTPFSSMRFKLKDEVSSLEPGIYNIKFKVVCPICDEQAYYEYIPICIYQLGNDPVDDCGGIWWSPNFNAWW